MSGPMEISMAAFLLQRGCPEDRLDAAYNELRRKTVPMTLAEAVEDADWAIREVT